MNYLNLITVIPALALCVYVFYKDRAEKEPFGLLMLLTGAGVVICLPAKLLSMIVSSLFDSAFEPYVSFSISGVPEYTSDGMMYLHGFLCSVIAVALIEETFKWLAVFFITRKNENFNSLFDGIVYHVFLSVGFALAENLMIVYRDGTDTLLIRAFISVPAHLLFGILSGFFYTVWHVYKKASDKENGLISDKTFTKKRIRSAPIFIILSAAAPVFIHGISAFSETVGTRSFRFAYFVIAVLLYAVCFAITGAVSRRDDTDEAISDAILRRAHGDTGTEGER